MLVALDSKSFYFVCFFLFHVQKAGDYFETFYQIFIADAIHDYPSGPDKIIQSILNFSRSCEGPIVPPHIHLSIDTENSRYIYFNKSL